MGVNNTAVGELVSDMNALLTKYQDRMSAIEFLGVLEFMKQMSVEALEDSVRG